MAPTRRAAYVLALLAIAVMAIRIELILAAVAVLVGLTVGDAWLSRRIGDVERTVPPLLSRGVGAAIEVRPEDGRRLEVRQPTPPDLSVDPPQQREGLIGTLTARRRGRHTLGPSAIRSRGPLGLGQSFHRTGDDFGLDVYPDMVAAKRLANQVRTARFSLEGSRRRGPIGLGTEFESIRGYVDGDDIRQVNWLATARTGSTMVNQWRIEQDRDVVCVIDAGRLMGAPIGGLTRLDAAVDVAAAVAAVADVVGDRVGVLAFSDRILREMPARHRGGSDVATTIFDLEPEFVDSDYMRAFQHVGSLKRAFVVVLTDLVDETASRPLGEAIPVLARRHTVAVASVTDPDLSAALSSRPESLEDVARAAVAHDVLEARTRVVEEVRRRGATVIEADAGVLSARVVAAYLQAKSLARF